MREVDIRDIKRENEIDVIRKRDIARFFQAARFVHVDCPGCGSAKYKFTFQKEKFTFVTCSNCETVFVNPRPPEEDLKRYYTEAEAPREFAKMVKVREGKRKELIYVERANSVASTVEKYLVDSEDISIMEVGAGTGGFLEVLREKKPEWHYISIEPGKASARYLKEKGFEVIDDIIENIDDSRIPNVNVVLNSEFIEHIFDTYKYIKKIYTILPRGGLFILTTPNYNGFDFLTIGKEYKNIGAPSHLNYFNPNSIKILLQRANFYVSDITTPGQLDVDLIKGYYSKTKNTGNKFLDFLLYKTSDEVLYEFQRFLQEHRLSGHMRIVARKPHTRS